MAKRKGKGGGFSKRQQAQSSEKQQSEQKKALFQLLIGAVVIFAVTAVFLFIIPQIMGTAGSNEAEAEPSANIPPAVSEVGDSGDRALASVDPALRANYYNAPPPQVIDPTQNYEAVITTEKGEMRLNLFAAQAPETVNNFVYLANQGFYDGTTFHRVLEGFMAQAGDPTGTGSGGPGYQFGDEIDPSLTFDRGGLLAMANAGPGTNGSQFFITYEPTPWLNGGHTIFGELTEGQDVLDSIRLRDPASDPAPGDVITRIEILVNER